MAQSCCSTETERTGRQGTGRRGSEGSHPARTESHRRYAMEGERQCKWTFISQSPSLREGIWGQRMTAVQQTCHACFVCAGNRVISLTANFLSVDHMPGALVSPLRTSSHLPQHPCKVHHNHPLVGGREERHRWAREIALVPPSAHAGRLLSNPALLVSDHMFFI